LKKKLAESSKEGYGPKVAVLPMTMMMILISFSVYGSLIKMDGET
jgi:hypothetical protein